MIKLIFFRCGGGVAVLRRLIGGFTMRSPTSDSASETAERLTGILRGYGRVAVAFSAGVDSTVVAKAAFLAVGDSAVAVTGTSASLADGELEQARDLAARIGIRHVIVETSELSDPRYVRNASDRCYFCKTELYTQLAGRTAELGVDVIVNGANLDDRGDYRPGMLAAGEHAVRSPLIEAGLDKAGVRQLAQFWGLPVWNKPATPCLSSRIAYGVEVTPERLRRVDRAETFLKAEFGLRELRVRSEANGLARIEVPTGSIAMMLQPAARQRISEELRALGFRCVTVDLEGLRSGSLNDVIPTDQLRRFNIATQDGYSRPHCSQTCQTVELGTSSPAD